MCLVLLVLREEESVGLAHVLLNVGLSLGSCDFFFFFFFFLWQLQHADVAGPGSESGPH